MCTFRVLLHHGSSRNPSLQLVIAPDDLAAQEVADRLLTEAPDAIGVEVWLDRQVVYVRGAAPIRTPG